MVPLPDTSSSFANCFIRDSVTEVVLLVFIIPLFQLLSFPAFIANMLRRMGIGLFLLMLSQCGYAILEVVGHNMDHSVSCAFANHNNTQILPISYLVMMAPQFLLHLLARRIFVPIKMDALQQSIVALQPNIDMVQEVYYNELIVYGTVVV